MWSISLVAAAFGLGAGVRQRASLSRSNYNPQPADLLTSTDQPNVVLYYETWSVWVRGYSVGTMAKNLLALGYPWKTIFINHAFFVPEDQGFCRLRSTDTDADGKKEDTVFGIAVNWGLDQETTGNVAGSITSMAYMRSKFDKLLLLPSIGGWSRSHTFHQCVQTSNRSKFINSILAWVRTFNYDGVDLDWEYPSCDGGCGCQGENVCPNESNVAAHGDWDVYKSFLTELRSALTTSGSTLGKYLWLSMAIGMNPDMLEGIGKYDVPIPFDFLCDSSSPVDFLNLMTYDIFGPWAPLAGVLAPMGDNPATTEDDRWNLDWGIKQVLARCGNPAKLNMGLATYGKSWAGVPKNGPDAATPGLWATSTITDFRVEGTWETGTISFWDLTQNYLPKCTRTFDTYSQTPTLYCDTHPTNAAYSNLFVSYEDAESWAYKAAYAKAAGFGGVIVWAASDLGNGGTQGDTTQVLFNGLFKGWQGKDLSCTGGGSIPTATTPTRWAAYPCPMVQECLVENLQNPSRDPCPVDHAANPCAADDTYTTDPFQFTFSPITVGTCTAIDAGDAPQVTAPAPGNTGGSSSGGSNSGGSNSGGSNSGGSSSGGSSSGGSSIGGGNTGGGSIGGSSPEVGGGVSPGVTTPTPGGVMTSNIGSIGGGNTIAPGVPTWAPGSTYPPWYEGTSTGVLVQTTFVTVMALVYVWP